jgi:hypothetical protein
MLIAGSIASRTEAVEVSFDNLDLSDQIPLVHAAWNQAHTFGDLPNFIDTHNEPPPEID